MAMRWFLLLGLCVWANFAQARDFTVFAAASLKAPIDAALTAYAEETGRHGVASYAASSTLARQIQYGAPVDVFISADPRWMQEVVTLGPVEAWSVMPVAGNRLILAGEGDGLSALMTTDGRIAVPLVDAVPLGRYAKEALESQGLWPEIAPRLVQTDNALTTKTLLLRGEVPLAFLYASDAHDGSVNVLHEFASEDHTPILYQAGAVRTSGLGFVMWLALQGGPAIFAEHGFTRGH